MISSVAMPDVATPYVSGPKRGAGETRQMVLALVLQGLKTRAIAELAGISTQAVNQHLARLRADGQLKEKAS